MSEVADFIKQFERCLMNEPAFCTAACPFGFDARAFTEKVRQGRIAAAYRQYRDAVVFPGIVSKICDRPCEKVCPTGKIDRAIDLQGLEQFAVMQEGKQSPSAYNLPPRGKRVCIVGAGLSGLACALKLSQKKYDVTIFEAAAEFGGHIVNDGEISRTDISREIEKQFQNEKYTLHTNRRITSQSELAAMGFDAVYAATGAGGACFGSAAAGIVSGADFSAALPCATIPRKDNITAPADGANRGGLHDLAAEAGICLIAGGALVGSKDIYAIADGIFAATAIDTFLRTGVLITNRPKRKTNMVLADIHLERYRRRGELCSPVNLAEAEAARCLGCRCDASMVYADLPAYTGKWPPRMRDEIFATTLPGKAEVKATPARRLINTGNLSGVFKDVCPVHIDMDGADVFEYA
jgi:hypothetical protein